MSRRNKNRPAGGTEKQMTATLDAFSNPLFSLGYGSQSPLEATEYPLTRMTDNYALLNSLYRSNWVVQNVVGLLVDDMVREWYDLKSATPEQGKAIQTVERSTRLRDRVSTGLKWGRLYGGAAGLILIDGQEDLSRPLDAEAILPGSFRGLYILDRWQGISPDAGLTFEGGELVPEYYSINDAAGHTAARVHHSRLVRFVGRELPDLERQAELYWGESEVEALYNDVVAHDNVSANMAALTFQANINTMEVKGLEQLLSMSSPDVQRRFWNTMQAQKVLRSNFGMQLVEQGNKISNTQYTFAGLSDVYESMCLNLCGASHYPMTKLFGRSPAGMNATGESDLKNYYDYVDTLRESKLRPILDKLLPVVARSAGIEQLDLDVTFPPLWTPTASETATIAKEKTDVIIAAFQAGLLDADVAMRELKKLEDETGLFSSLTDELIAAKQGLTYQDVTALRDPLAGISEKSELKDSVIAMDYSPDQPRDDYGRWTDGGGSSSLNYQEPENGWKNEEDTDRKLQKERENWENSLSGFDRESINEYTSSSESINSALRSQAEIPAATKQSIDSLDKVVANYELKEDISTIRGLSKEALESMGVNVENPKGSIFKEKAYTSASLSDGVAAEFATYSGGTPILLQIDVPAGKGRGAYIEYLGANSGEREFLIKRDSSFEVYGADNSGTIPIVKARLLV